MPLPHIQAPLILSLLTSPLILCCRLLPLPVPLKLRCQRSLTIGLVVPRGTVCVAAAAPRTAGRAIIYGDTSKGKT